MEDNRLLTALASLERIEPRFKIGKRDQLTRADLENIKLCINKVVNTIGQMDINVIYVLAYLTDASELIDLYLNDVTFSETSTEIKDVLVAKFMKGKSMMYVTVGKYYTTHEFTYNWQMDKLLTRIVDICLEEGYYFGFDKEGGLDFETC